MPAAFDIWCATVLMHHWADWVETVDLFLKLTILALSWKYLSVDFYIPSCPLSQVTFCHSLSISDWNVFLSINATLCNQKKKPNTFIFLSVLDFKLIELFSYCQRYLKYRIAVGFAHVNLSCLRKQCMLLRFLFYRSPPIF